MPGQAQRALGNNEIDAINAKFKAESLVSFFRGYFIAHLLRADGPRSQMHLTFLQNLGQRDGMFKTYMVKVLEEMEGAMRRLDRLDPRYDTWDFLLLTVRLQASIKRTIETPDEALEAQLANYEQLSLRFERPSELQRERRNFNTNLLNALQEGIGGNFGVAGTRLEQCLRSIPPGSHIDPLTGGLRMLREGCRNPESYKSTGKDLTSEFERLYQKVRDANIRGSDDARIA